MAFRYPQRMAVRTAAWMLLAAAAAPSMADTSPRNVVQFSTSATQELTQDLMTVTLQFTKEGAQATEVQSAVKQVLDAALSDAKHAASSSQGGMSVRTGQFSIQPRYTNGGRINGWQGSAQLVLEGTDATRISQTAGKLSQLNIVNVQYGLSRALREQHESALTEQAIARFRARASQMAAAFGLKGYSLGEISVSSTEPGFESRPPVFMAMRAKAMEAADAALPVEPGKGLLSVTVSGQVILTP